MEADKLTSLAAALEYVEQNLTSDFSQEKCARYACCSLSGLQKLFRSVFRRSVGDYVARRRLTAAARELQQTDRTAIFPSFTTTSGPGRGHTPSHSTPRISWR